MTTPFPFPFEKLFRPDGEYVAYLRTPQLGKSEEIKKCEVVFCGGFMSDMSGTKAAFLRDLGAREKFLVTTFDYYGHGVSSGELTKGGFTKGEFTKGGFTRGELTKGELMKGELTKGELTKGELTKGELTKGDLTKGELTKGELKKEELTKGEFTKGTISHWLEDTLAIIDDVTSGPLILIGSSMGGWLMTLAALRRPNRVKGLIGIAVAPDFTENLIWEKLSETTQNQLRKERIIYIPSKYSENGRYPITSALIEDGRKNLILQHTIPLEIPIHLIHGTEDFDVPWKYSYELMEKVGSQYVTVTLIKGGDHRLSTPEGLKRLAKAIQEMQSFLK